MAEIISVREVMTKNVKTVRPDTGVREVIAHMISLDIGSVVVVQGERPIGLITERDVLKKLYDQWMPIEAAKAQDVMSSPVVTISEDATISDAAQLMLSRKVKKLVVIGNGRLVGIVTYTDIALSVPNMLRTLELLVRPHRNR